MASAPVTKENGQIVPRSQAPKNDLVTMLQKMAPEIQRALPKHVTADRMSRIVLTAIRTTPKLADCTPASFLGAVMSCAQLGLEPNTPLGHAYLIPRWSGKRKCNECTLQIGYQGMLDLSRRSGLTSAIYAYAVRKGDEFSYELGLHPTITHRPSQDEGRESQPITHVYAVAKLKDGEPVFTVLTRAQVEERRKRSSAADSGPWVTDYEAMCLKTAIRAVWRWLPKSTEIARAIALDEAPEIGTPQAIAWDPNVTKVLAAEGIDTEGETVTEDGEIVNEPPEPGSAG